MGVQSFFFFEARRTFMFETGSLERTLFYGILLNIEVVIISIFFFSYILKLRLYKLIDSIWIIKIFLIPLYAIRLNDNKIYFPSKWNDTRDRSRIGKFR